MNNPYNLSRTFIRYRSQRGGDAVARRIGELSFILIRGNGTVNAADGCNMSRRSRFAPFPASESVYCVVNLKSPTVIKATFRKMPYSA